VLLGQGEVAMRTRLTSELGAGFYGCLAYCLFAVAWTQILGYRRGG